MIIISSLISIKQNLDYPTPLIKYFKLFWREFFRHFEAAILQASLQSSGVFFNIVSTRWTKILPKCLENMNMKFSFLDSLQIHS